MKILYVANHNQRNSNDDEGAVTYALRKLGHMVVTLQETEAHEGLGVTADLLLFHKWYDPDLLAQYQILKTFWYFDLVECDDPTVERRSEQRRQWMKEIVPLVDVGFCTDGDWVNKDTTGKLRWLCQGADERVCGTVKASNTRPKIVFTGTRNGGQRRQAFVQHMQEKYGSDFHHVERGVHREGMRQLCADAQIMVAPDFPIGKRYWSNRVYNTLGFGGFLLHPYCAGLIKHYHPGEELLMYESRDHLHLLIENCLALPNVRAEISRLALEKTLRCHTYTHRVACMIDTITKLKV